MPTPATAKLPKPRSEDEFEDIAVDFLRIRWRDPNATRNGRRGQRQHGVDIVGYPSWTDGKIAGAQCKNVETLTLAAVVAEAEKAKGFAGGLAEFKIVTAAERDAALQSAVREHFRANPVAFDVDVVFWPDIVDGLAGDERLVSKYWKGFSPSGEVVWMPPSPCLLHEATRDEMMRSEWQYEMAVWPAAPLSLDTSELAYEIEALARKDVGGPVPRVLVQKPSVTLSDGLKWAFEQKPYGNVRNRWELEVRDHGFLAYRWGEWTHGTDRWCSIGLFTDGVLLPLGLYQAALREIAAKVPSTAATKFKARLSAHGDGPLKLNDDAQLTIPADRTSAPESPAEWSVEVDGDHGVHVVDSGTRLLNRALAKFTFKTIGQFFGGTAPSQFLRINETRIQSLYGRETEKK